MNEFDLKAGGWDENPMHRERAEAVAQNLLDMIPLNGNMKALEYGAGTGLTSFILKDKLHDIILMDSSPEMVKVTNEKISSAKASNLKAVLFDLEKITWKNEKFDLILTQMVLHHVNNINGIIKKFKDMLNTGGYLAIADLFPEDGSFHGESFTGHKGFDPEKLSGIIISSGFRNVSYRKCFTINKKIPETVIKQFDVFLMTAIK